MRAHAIVAVSGARCHRFKLYRSSCEEFYSICYVILHRGKRSQRVSSCTRSDVYESQILLVTLGRVLFYMLFYSSPRKEFPSPQLLQERPVVRAFYSISHPGKCSILYAILFLTQERVPIASGNTSDLLSSYIRPD